MSTNSVSDDSYFDIVEASIQDHREALASGRVTSVDLVIAYLLRIATYDISGGLNAFTLFNPAVFEEAAASDARRACGVPPRPLEGIPYTLKDSFKYEGLTVTNGSPALKGLRSSEDSAIGKRFREAGAVLIGKTNMPPMAAGGMQRGMYGRAESPYNLKYLTAAFSSGSSNGAATSLATSMAAFGMGSETVSSGRSPASNNALIAYTPSRGILSCRGLWPLYVTCDTPVPYARSMKDMFEIMEVIGQPDPETKGDFWREQKHVKLPIPKPVDYRSLTLPDSLRGKRVGVPKLYIGQQDSDPYAKPITVNPDVVKLWERARLDLEALGAEIVYTDFPLVTNYENDSVSGEANNVVGRPGDWNPLERSFLIAKAWDDFLVQNKDPKIPSLEKVNNMMLFPKPKGYIPDRFLEVRNWIHYDRLPQLAATHKKDSILDFPGLAQALKALEAQRKRDLEDWMHDLKLDCVAFPANGDVGYADLEFDVESATHSHKNGVRYSNGNRAFRHMGVPTVSVPMGVMEGRQMPVNLTFAGKAYEDEKLLAYAYAYEQQSKRRVVPPSTPPLATDKVTPRSKPSSERKIELTVSMQTKKFDDSMQIFLSGAVKGLDGKRPTLQIYLDGVKAPCAACINAESWEVVLEHETKAPERLDWSLEPMPPRPVMVLVVARVEGATTVARLLWASYEHDSLGGW